MPCLRFFKILSGDRACAPDQDQSTVAQQGETTVDEQIIVQAEILCTGVRFLGQVSSNQTALML